MTFSPRWARWLAPLVLLGGCGFASDPKPKPIVQEEPPPGTTPPLNPAVPPVTEQVGPGGMKVLTALPRSLPRLAFEQWTVGQTAIESLIRIGRPAVPALINLLDQPDEKLRSEAVVALARIGPDAQAAVPRLIALVDNDPAESVRKNAVRALGQIGPAAAPAVPVLVEQLRAEASPPPQNHAPAPAVQRGPLGIPTMPPAK